MPQHLSINDSRRVFRSYTKISNFQRNMQQGVHNANPAAAAVEFQRLQNANHQLTQNLAEKYGINQDQIYVNMFRTLEGHMAQNAVARNVGRAGKAWQNRKAVERANAARARKRSSPILRELVAVKYNPYKRVNRMLRRPYAKSASPYKSPRTPLRRTMSAPNRAKPKTPSPHRKLNSPTAERITTETLNSIRPSHGPRAKRPAKRARTT
jgi:hypothetical protein